MKLCLIEDDLLLGRSLKSALEALAHEVLWLRLIADARRFLRVSEFDAVLLDLGLPDGEGIEFLRNLRVANNRLPVLIITAREALENRLQGFDAGADDYIVKPFDIAELDARLRAVLRRGAIDKTESRSLNVGDLNLDLAGHCLKIAGRECHLSPTEYELLFLLMSGPGRVFTRRQIEDRILPESEAGSLDVHISNLRRKIGSSKIRTVRGVGYIMDTVA